MGDSANPGAMQYGNFFNYYEFNNANDRLMLLPSDAEIWQSRRADASPTEFIVLDVGCNCGDLTQLLYEFLCQHTRQNVRILGVDIDPILIERAIEKNKFPDHVHYVCCDITDPTQHVISDYLAQRNEQRFDAVFCFSITMWIHLNNGDTGLMRFLDHVQQFSRMLIIEPQPWRCYQTAVRRMKRGANKSFPLFADLKLRQNIEFHITQHLRVVCKLKIIYESQPTKWNRKIYFFTS